MPYGMFEDLVERAYFMVPGMFPGYLVWFPPVAMHRKVVHILLFINIKIIYRITSSLLYKLISASAQVPDKSALAWVACPGILHRS